MRGEMVYRGPESQAIPSALVDHPLDPFFFVRWRTSVRTKQPDIGEMDTVAGGSSAGGTRLSGASR